MESYRELRERQQREFNELPLGFAFSITQFNEMMERWGLDPVNDTEKIHLIPGGGYIQKKDRDHLIDTLARFDTELQAAKDSDLDGTGFLYQMFRYELANHEYAYTGELDDTLDSLGITMDEINGSPAMTAALHNAIRAITGEEEN